MSTEQIEHALQAVRKAFSARRQPVNVPYQTCCVSKAYMKQIWSTPYEQLTGADLHTLVWHTDSCWGGWSDLAFYVPRLATLYTQGALMDEGIFLSKLVRALPSETERLISAPEKMLPAEQRSLAQLMLAVLEYRLSQPEYRSDWESPLDTLVVLGMFDLALDPFLQRWKASENPAMQRNLLVSLLDYGRDMASCNLHYRREEPIRGPVLYIDLPVLSMENREALDALLNPDALASYLLEHIEAAEQIGPEWKTGIAEAYDWAVRNQQQSND